MKLFHYTIFSLLFTSTIANSVAQTVEKKMTSKIDSLKKQGVDTLVVFDKYCTDDPSSAKNLNKRKDTCIATETLYLFWKNKGTTYVQVFDNCKPRPPFNANNLKLLDFYFANKAQIDMEEMRPPEREPVMELDENGDTTWVTGSSAISVSYSCDYFFEFEVKNTLVEKSCIDYYIYFSEFSDGKENINWEYNQTTKLKELIELAVSESVVIQTWLKELDLKK